MSPSLRPAASPSSRGVDRMVAIAAMLVLCVASAAPAQAAVETIFEDGFESGDFVTGGWSTSGVATVDATSTHTGSYAARVDDSGSLQTIIDASGHEDITLEYARYTYAYDLGEELTVEWSTNGVDWTLIETYNAGWALTSVSLGAGADDAPALYIRFRSDANGAYERFRVDDVVVRGETDGGSTNSPPQFVIDPITGADAVVGSGYAGSIAGSATDADGDPLTYSRTSGPAWLGVAADGTLSGTPGSSDLGLNTFGVAASDGIGAGDAATLEILVVEGGGGPVVLFEDGFESGDISAGGWTSSGTATVDTTANSGSYAARIDDSGHFQKVLNTVGYHDISLEYARYTYNYDAGEFLYVEWSTDGSGWTQLEGYQSGWGTTQFELGAAADHADSLHIRFRSNADGSFERFRIDDVVVVGTSGPPPSNDPPVFTGDPILASDATEGAPYADSLSGTAFDPDGDPLTFSKTGGPAWLSVAADGALAGTPGAGDTGLNFFTVLVSDGRGGADTASLEIDVNACPPGGCGPPPTTDPGTGPWQPVGDVAAECNLDPDLLEDAEAELGYSFLIVRYGKLCHEYYPGIGGDSPDAVWSTTKTLGSVTVGALVHQSRDIPRTGSQTGPLMEFDRADHWLNSFSYNDDATIAHVLAMEAHNSSLDYGDKSFSYDTVGSVQINTLSDVVNEVVSQDPARLGSDIGDFYVRYVHEPLGIEDSTWGTSNGSSSKNFAYSWDATARDMARVGLLMLNGGVWNGERIMDLDYLYNQSHAAFEDGSTRYGYLTWLMEDDDCAPAPVHTAYPHGISEAPSCLRPGGCDQTYDVGVFYAAGLGGQYIVQHRGLDMVIVAKGTGGQSANDVVEMWEAIRPAVVAMDPVYAGNESAFCDAYGAGDYAPDLKLWEDGR